MMMKMNKIWTSNVSENKIIENKRRKRARILSEREKDRNCLIKNREIFDQRNTENKVKIP